MHDVSTRYQQVLQRISAASVEANGSQPPQLLAVSKKHAIEKIKMLYDLGQHDFGESYAQEGVAKIQDLSDLPLTWHFIGPIQSNKTQAIATHFDWVHSVDRMKILQRLSAQRPASRPVLNVLLQLKVGDEVSKSGASLDLLLEMAALGQSLPGIKIRGVMCIPPPSDDFEVQKAYCLRAHDAFVQLAENYPGIDTLSMGMSNDLEAAIAAGATLVRVGTDIFGPRG